MGKHRPPKRRNPGPAYQTVRLRFCLVCRQPGGTLAGLPDGSGYYHQNMPSCVAEVAAAIEAIRQGEDPR